MGATLSEWKAAVQAYKAISAADETMKYDEIRWAAFSEVMAGLLVLYGVDVSYA